MSDSRFQPRDFETFHFLERRIGADGRVQLRYGLDDAIEFTEELQLPAGGTHSPEVIDRLLSLLHWVAGVSYYKTAAPPRVSLRTGTPPAAAATLLEALYSEGLGEFAAVNGLPELPRPRFHSASHGAGQAGIMKGATVANGSGEPRLARVLVPVGGGKDSAVAIEIARRAGVEVTLFSVGDAPPIRRTAQAAGLPRLVVARRLDPRLAELNARGALNGHVPITAIVSCIALLTAALRGFDAVALANERSASEGNTMYAGVEINHQFSKSARAESLLAAAAAEAAPGLRIFSLLRPASELAIARAFARLHQYHAGFTSCNTVFRLDPSLRRTSWCGECDKCRFVFLILAPFLTPDALQHIFGAALLDDESQYEGFARLTATGDHKPFECVGEVAESVAAIRLLAGDPRWRERPVVRRLTAEVLPLFHGAGDPAAVLALSGAHRVPPELMDGVHALLGA